MKRSGFLGMLPAVPLLPGAIVRPSPSYRDALVLVRALQARDDVSIRPDCRTALYDHGQTTDLAVVLLHGFTNCPAQYARFAHMLHARGCNVLVPRLPQHGDVDRMTTRLEPVTADQLTASANEAVDAARGLGRRLAVSGLSLGGVLCAWLATRRPDVDRVVSLAPSLAIGHLPFALGVLVAQILLAMPSTRYAWWDPALKESITPQHAYPRYPLRVLGENYRIGQEVLSAQGPFPGRGRTQAIFALNPLDPAVNNEVTAIMADQWRGRDWLSTSVNWLRGLPPVHDIIEPTNQPESRIMSVYPRLIDLIVG